MLRLAMHAATCRESRMLKLSAGPLRAAAVAASLLWAPAAAEEPVTARAERVASFKAPEARQGVAVDGRFFYAIDNRKIAKYDKKTGGWVAGWKGPSDGPIVHLDSGVVVDGKLYAAHSNYPGWPMVSSVEIWDAATLRHVDSHSFGIGRGSLTWLDFHNGVWWGAFANYNQPLAQGPVADGSQHTQVVRFDGEWRVAEAWVFPKALLEKFGDMSNSGGSWGPDGRLWITGHDKAEAYAVMLPQAGSVLRWTATASLDIAGQGIAWDRSDRQVIWGIVRGAKGENRVAASRVTLP
jgi:hypothetical protein